MENINYFREAFKKTFDICQTSQGAQRGFVTNQKNMGENFRFYGGLIPPLCVPVWIIEILALKIMG